MNWSLLKNSVLVSGATTTLCVGLGFLAALALVTAPRPWRGALLAFSLAALALPPFLVVNTWLDAFGAAGALRTWLPIPLFSLTGATAVLTCLYWPISAVLILGAWDRLEPAQIEADALLRRGPLLRWVLWPAARGPAALAAIVTLVLSFNQFTVPVILQVPVFPEELWLALTARLDESGAWTAAVPMILMPMLALVALRGRVSTWPRMAGPPGARAISDRIGPGWKQAARGTLGTLLAISLALPLAQLTGQARTWTEIPGLLRSSPEVVAQSLTTALVTACLTVVAGMLLRRQRWGFLFWPLFFIPGLLLGQLLARLLGGTLIYGTTALVWLAAVLRHLALAWQGAREAERSLDRDLIDAGRLAGARGWALFRSYVWPQMARPIAGAWYVVYLLALWDVESMVLIHPPGGDTLPLRIFQLLHYGHNAQVNAMCVILLALALAPLAVWKVMSAAVDLRVGFNRSSDSELASQREVD